MILDVYKDAFEYSAQDWKALIKLGVIYLFSFLVFPIFLALGYSYRVIKIGVNGMINGEDKLPEFNEWIDMFVDGIKLWLVNLIYAIIPAVLFIVFLLVAGAVGGTAGAAIMIVGIVISIIIGIIFALMDMIAVANMAEEDDSLSAAFDFEYIINAIKSIGWLNAVATWIGMELIILIIFLVVSFILGLIFIFLGFSGSLLAGANVGNGVVGAGNFILTLILLFLVGPYTSIFQHRVIGLFYNLQ